jgi:hypothetical protein
LEPEDPYLGGFGGRRAYKTYKTPAGNPCPTIQDVLVPLGKDFGAIAPKLPQLHLVRADLGDKLPLGAPEEAGPASSRPGARHRNTGHPVANGWPPTRVGAQSVQSRDLELHYCQRLGLLRSLLRPTYPGAHGRCVDRYARFGSMTATTGLQRRLGGGRLLSLHVQVTAKIGSTARDAGLSVRSANGQRTARPVELDCRVPTSTCLRNRMNRMRLHDPPTGDHLR